MILFVCSLTSAALWAAHSVGVLWGPGRGLHVTLTSRALGWGADVKGGQGEVVGDTDRETARQVGLARLLGAQIRVPVEV